MSAGEKAIFLGLEYGFDNREKVCRTRELLLDDTSAKPEQDDECSNHQPIPVRPARVEDYLTAPVRCAFEHLVGLPGFVEPEHFANFSL
jgi:hypothetical protein